MGRRLVAAAAALVLALVGATVLLAYARGADARALAGLRTQTVYVAAEAIPAGTPAAGLAKLVQPRALPSAAVVDGAVRDLATLSGEVTTVAILPGEQLLAGRFAAPTSLLAPGTVAVPAGDEEISVQLEPERAVGGRLAAGNQVGVFVSRTLPDGSVQTHAVLHHVLVTQVQGATVPTSGTATAASAAPAAAVGHLVGVLLRLLDRRRRHRPGDPGADRAGRRAGRLRPGARQALALPGTRRRRHRPDHGPEPGQHPVHHRPGVAR